MLFSQPAVEVDNIRDIQQIIYQGEEAYSHLTDEARKDNTHQEVRVRLKHDGV